MRSYLMRTGGLVLLAAALIPLFVGSTQSDVRTATYKGSKMCKACHKGIHKEIVEAFDATAHPKALQEASAEGAIVADFAIAPIKKEDIAWVLGVGHRNQAYIDKDWKTLPAMWVVADKKWSEAPVVDAKAKCVACHTTGFNPADMTWVETGVGCESCHGPGSEHISASAENRKTTVILLSQLPKDRQMMVCARCHSSGTDPSKNHPFPTDFRPGDDLNKVFIQNKPTGSGQNQQYSDLITSKHFDVGNTCTTCHEPHKNTGQPLQLKKEENELCMDCHKDKIKDLATHQPSAPANAKCGDCHMPDGRHTFMKGNS